MAKKENSPFTVLGLLTKMGLGMITPILAGVLIGNYLDRRFTQGHFFLILMTILGALAAFCYLYLMGTRLSSQKERFKE